MDSHIDALSSGINGTMVAVCAEDDDRVTEGELLVEIDPRDYEVAVEQAKARLESARAQVASTRQDYDAALADVARQTRPTTKHSETPSATSCFSSKR
jgi:membrane fusion protein (multidrug efflux system)